MKTNKLMLWVLGLMLLFRVAAATAADAPKLTFKFKTINVPEALQTSVGMINNAGVKVGQYQDKKGVYHGYILDGTNLTTLDDPNGTNTAALGIEPNSASVVVGYYKNSSTQQYRGFLYESGTFKDILGPKGAISSNADAINDQGWIVGYYEDSNGIYHGFLLQGKKYTTLDVPTATDSYAFGINNKGNIVLTWYKSTYPYKGSLYKYHAKTYTTIEVPGAGPEGSLAQCINNEGDIPFLWYDSKNLAEGALLHDGKYYKFGYPKAFQTYPSGINDKNAIVGAYQSKDNGPVSGFKATFK
jgi:uncharacterized membrane protein